MNNFYEDFLQDSGQLTVLSEAYENAFKAINDRLSYVDDLGTISSIPTYKTIPYQRIESSSACYTLERLLNADFTSLGVPIDPIMPFDERLAIWNNLAPSKKAEIVGNAGYTITLEGYSGIEDVIDHSNGRDFVIQSFDLYDSDYKLMLENADYYYSDNKIYLLREYDLKDINTKRFLIFRNIVIDYNIPQNRMGDDLKIEYNKVLTKFEYNEVLKSFTMASLSGPKLNSLNSALNEYGALDGIKIVDKRSARGADKSLWLSNEKGLGRFDFAVKIPVSLLTNTDKLEVITDLLSKTKPAFTDFGFVPHLGIVDENLLSKALNKVTMFSKMNPKDKLPYDDSMVKIIYKIDFLEQVKQTITPAILDDPRFHTDTGIMLDYITIRDNIWKHKVTGKFVSMLSTTNQVNKRLDNTELSVVNPIKEQIQCEEEVHRIIMKLDIFESERLSDSVETNIIRNAQKAMTFRDKIKSLAWLKKK